MALFLDGGRSCSTQVLEILESRTKDIGEGYDNDCIYLDFAKAYNKLPHQRLLKKLSAQGIGGDLHTWMKSFLTGRIWRIAYNRAFSRWSEVMSVIPHDRV